MTEEISRRDIFIDAGGDRQTHLAEEHQADAESH
jgi:hypothetical protein